MAIFVPKSASECVLAVGVGTFPVVINRRGVAAATSGTVTDVFVVVRADKLPPDSWACFPCMSPPEPATWATRDDNVVVGGAAKAAALQVGCGPVAVDCVPSVPAADCPALTAALSDLGVPRALSGSYAHYARVPINPPSSTSRGSIGGDGDVAVLCCAWMQDLPSDVRSRSSDAGLEDPDGPAALAREQRLDLEGWPASRAAWVTRMAKERHGRERLSAAFLPIATNAVRPISIAAHLPVGDLGLFCGVTSWRGSPLLVPPEATTHMDSPDGGTAIDLRCTRIVEFSPENGIAHPEACVFVKDCSDPDAVVGAPYKQRAPRRCSVALNGAIVVDRTRTRALDCMAVADLDVVPTVAGCHVMRVDPPAAAGVDLCGLCAYAMPVMLPPLSIAVLEDVWCGDDTAAFALSIAMTDGSARTFFADPQHKYYANGVRAVYATEDKDLFARMLSPRHQATP